MTSVTFGGVVPRDPDRGDVLLVGSRGTVGDSPLDENPCFPPGQDDCSVCVRVAGVMVWVDQKGTAGHQ